MPYIYSILFSFNPKNMQEIKSAFDRIATLDATGIGLREPEALRLLNDVYSHIFGETIDSGCEGCLRKAFGKLQILTLEKLTTMKTSKFKLKPGIVLPFGEFGSGETLTKDNLTDAKAYEQLKRYPGQLEYFTEYPMDEDGGLLPMPDEDIIETAKEPITPVITTALTVIQPNEPIVPEKAPEAPENESEKAAPETITTDVDGNVKEDSKPTRKHLSKISSADLIAEYKELYKADPEPGLTKAELNDAILKLLK